MVSLSLSESICHLKIGQFGHCLFLTLFHENVRKPDYTSGLTRRSSNDQSPGQASTGFLVKVAPAASAEQGLGVALRSSVDVCDDHLPTMSIQTEAIIHAFKGVTY